MEDLKKENKRLSTLVDFGCLNSTQSKEALYKTMNNNTNQHGFGLGYIPNESKFPESKMRKVELKTKVIFSKSSQSKEPKPTSSSPKALSSTPPKSPPKAQASTPSKAQPKPQASAPPKPQAKAQANAHSKAQSTQHRVWSAPESFAPFVRSIR
uniref:Uncharacterized protein n=1 Tax=Leersia perrieri TaxID=77586 RepID=A0A0D9W4X0_9ORYZ